MVLFLNIFIISLHLIFNLNVYHMIETINTKQIMLLILGLGFTLIFGKIIYINIQSHAISAPREIVKTKYMKTLYRGEPRKKKRGKFAKHGIAKPFKGNATIQEHRDGDTRSNGTSWTTRPSIAVPYANFDRYGNATDGWILEKRFDLNSPDVFDVNSLRDGGDIFNELEFIIKGIITGCKVYYIPINSDPMTIETQIYLNQNF